MPEEQQPQQPVTSRQHKAMHRRRQVKEVKTKLGNLSPAAAAEVVNEVVAIQARKQVGGFTDFLRDQGVVGVGIGLVIGIQVKAVVDAIMAGFINPLTLAILPGKGTLDKQTVVVSIGGHHLPIGWGGIVYQLFSLLMVALIVYWGYKLLKLDKLAKKK